MISTSTANTNGTNTGSKRSVNCCVGAFCVPASATSVITRSSVRSPTAADTSTTINPSPFTEPAKTRSAGPFSTGTLSPVIGA